MNLIRNDERTAVAAVAALTDCNPFLPARLELERRILGPAFIPAAPVWHADGDEGVFDPNLTALRDRVTELTAELRHRLANGASASAAELADYRGLVLYFLWLRYEDDWRALIHSDVAGESPPATLYTRFAQDVAQFIPHSGDEHVDAAHLFALGFQLRRAFYHTFRKIFGASAPAARLRTAVWQSIFTHDTRRYRAILYKSMRDSSTLVTGESGTGKELVARAIALSQYVPFDATARRFVGDRAHTFCAVNLAAFNPALIESELFGHRRGAFTGATEDRNGWFGECDAHGAVFLDEIGELDATIQVKLLRVLNNREFQRIGDTTTSRFQGKIIAATNRDLQTEMDRGRFREDLYYRLCADMISTPTLREQLSAHPNDLYNLVLIVARRFGLRDEAERFAGEAHDWIHTHLGTEYPWPGNMRELEQCVRNILIRGEYRPPRAKRAKPDAADDLAAHLRGGHFSADELVTRYCQLVYAQTDSTRETARRLGLDPRTVRAKLSGANIATGDDEK